VTRALIERFRERLPVSPSTPVVSLGEGSTPLLAAPRLARAAGVRELWLKWEASNPTGSYKDRGMTVAVSKALESGAEAVICASTGNTAASAAAYATRAGLPAVVLTPRGAVSGAKLAQTRMLGATVLPTPDELCPVDNPRDGAIALLGVVGADDEDAGEYAHHLDLGHPVAVAGERVWLNYAAREPSLVALVSQGGKVVRGWPNGIAGDELARHLDDLIEQ